MRTASLVLTAVALLASPLVAQQPDPAEINTLMQQAQAAVQAGEWEKAVASCDKALAINPNVAPAHFFKGYALHSQQKYDEALSEHLKAAESGNPNISPIAFYNAACVYSIKGKADEAFATLEKSVAAGFNDASQIEGDADLDNIKEDPRFAKMMAKLRGEGGPTTGVTAQSFPPTNDARKSTRLFLYTSNGGFKPLGQVFVGYGPIDWKPQYDQAIESGRFDGQHWRLGKDFWTTIDTNVPIEIGGAEVEPGSYYLSLMRNADGTYKLGIHDPVEVRKGRFDAFQVQAGNIAAKAYGKMTHESIEEAASELTLSIRYDSDPTNASFRIEFGPHRVSCPLRVKL